MSVEEGVDADALIERWDSALRALAAAPRRQIVASLSEAPPGRELSLPEAANPPVDLRDPEQLAVELVHEHLPMLSACEYVEWSREPLTVQCGDAFEEVAFVVEALEDAADDVPDRMAEGLHGLDARRGRER